MQFGGHLGFSGKPTWPAACSKSHGAVHLELNYRKQEKIYMELVMGNLWGRCKYATFPGSSRVVLRILCTLFAQVLWKPCKYDPMFLLGNLWDIFLQFFCLSWCVCYACGTKDHHWIKKKMFLKHRRSVHKFNICACGAKFWWESQLKLYKDMSVT